MHDRRGSEDDQDNQMIPISAKFIHPNYGTPDRAQDVALLKLRTPASLGKLTSPICLPEQGDFGDTSGFPAGADCILTGWGRMVGQQIFTNLKQNSDYDSRAQESQRLVTFLVSPGDYVALTYPSCQTRSAAISTWRAQTSPSSQLCSAPEEGGPPPATGTVEARWCARLRTDAGIRWAGIAVITTTLDTGGHCELRAVAL